MGGSYVYALVRQWHDRWARTPSLPVLSDPRNRMLYDTGFYDPSNEENEGCSDFVQEMLSLMALAGEKKFAICCCCEEKIPNESFWVLLFEGEGLQYGGPPEYVYGVGRKVLSQSRLSLARQLPPTQVVLVDYGQKQIDL
ncbi:hypothetical protein Ancab_021161 [Ancistrocladus abbreviatus]